MTGSRVNYFPMSNVISKCLRRASKHAGGRIRISFRNIAAILLSNVFPTIPIPHPPPPTLSTATVRFNSPTLSAPSALHLSLVDKERLRLGGCGAFPDRTSIVLGRRCRVRVDLGG